MAEQSLKLNVGDVVHASHVRAHAGLVLRAPRTVRADDARLFAAFQPQMGRQVSVPLVDIAASVAGVPARLRVPCSLILLLLMKFEAGIALAEANPLEAWKKRRREVVLVPGEFPRIRLL